MTSRNTALDGLRGWAALIVIFYHGLLEVNHGLVQTVLLPPIYEMGSLSDIANKILLTVLNGATSVSLFFVLSGTVLALSLDRRRSTHSLLGTSSTFVTSRLLRLYPTLIVAVTFMFMLSRIDVLGFQKFSLSDYLANALLSSPTIIGASGTIQVELLAIPFVLIVWLLYRKFGFPILVLAYLFTLGFHDTYIVRPVAQVWVYFGAFAVGMMVADPRTKRLFETVSGKMSVLIFAAMVVVRFLQSAQSASTEIEITLLCGLLVAVTLWSTDLGTFGSFLHSRISQFLGHISYSLYLLNVPFLVIGFNLFKPLGTLGFHGIATGLLVALFATIASIPLAWLSAKYVEAPSIRWGKKLGNFIYKLTEKPPRTAHPQDAAS